MINVSPTLELKKHLKKISKRIDLLEDMISKYEQKISDLYSERLELLTLAENINGCLAGADVSIWAEIQRLEGKKIKSLN